MGLPWRAVRVRVGLSLQGTTLSSEASWGGGGRCWPEGQGLDAVAHPSCICPAVRQIRLVQGLQEVEVREQGSVTMEVELSHADVEGSWTRDGLRLQPGPTCQLAVRGSIHTLTLSRLQPQDGGLIAFKAEGVHTSARLMVTGAWGDRWVGPRSGVGPTREHNCPNLQGGPGRQVGTGTWNPEGREHMILEPAE